MNPMMRRSLALGIAALLCAGCGEGIAPTQSATDPAQARQTLTSALDSWKQGQKHAEMPNASPPIRVADEDWLAGGKLQDYSLEGDGQARGSAVVWRVKLNLKTPQGRTVNKAVDYLVTGAPDASVIRQD